MSRDLPACAPRQWLNAQGRGRRAALREATLADSGRDRTSAMDADPLR